ncbi:hypothetical protein [Bacillus sp. AFS017336]|uniref:hypothetical protein n=1 Tax=Bacillus sp. AFS017336 TaxID=2033489 RepID=UPI000BF1C45E|nr:hypothetical protein [Bacillus sp. AFS017336]PEL13433.1 hypothetical protein CN601_04640 [Bacillus sp. AFS017336]
MNTAYSKKQLLILVVSLLMSFGIVSGLYVMVYQPAKKGFNFANTTLDQKRKVLANLKANQSNLSDKQVNPIDEKLYADKFPTDLQLEAFLTEIESAEKASGITINKIEQQTDSTENTAVNQSDNATNQQNQRTTIQKTTFTIQLDSPSVSSFYSFLSNLEASKRLIQVTNTACNVTIPSQAQIKAENQSSEQIQLESQENVLQTPVQKNLVQASVTISIFENKQ